ncbi:uncharacterized protein LOC106012713, partial [Aplysia californica]|uniref:Uncharacterized protein LOC106012713 n=1 Tax=Aplysia californica TaxID=6500 RepID=A0ABM1VYL3_APLCA
MALPVQVILLTAIGVSDAARKKALLLHYTGEEVFDKYETFSAAQKGSDTEAGYNMLCQSFTTHFAPQKNIDYETFKFRQARQEAGENIDSFCTRLRKLAATCDFQDSDRELKSQILQGCTSQRLRRRALRDDLDLQNLLKAARALEISDEQAQEIEADRKPATVYNISKQHAAKGKASRFPSATHRLYPPSQPSHRRYQQTHENRPCGWCGGLRHPRDRCPAKDKTCKTCSKLGHFSKVCRSGNKPSTHCRHSTAHVKHVTSNLNESSDTSEEDYVFGVKTNQMTPQCDNHTYSFCNSLCSESPELFKGLGKLKGIKVTLHQDP